MPDLVLHGKIVEVYDTCFTVAFVDADKNHSVADIEKRCIAQDEQSSVVAGNTLVYTLNGDKEIIHITKLRIFTQQDADNAKKIADTASKFLDKMDNA